MKKLSMPDSAGWVFFAVVFAALIYPLYLVVAEVTIETKEATTGRVTFSIFGAAIVAAVLTWVVNLTLERLTLLMQAKNGRKSGKSGGKVRKSGNKR